MAALLIPNCVQARLTWNVGPSATVLYSILHGVVPTGWVLDEHIVAMGADVTAAWTTAGFSTTMNSDTKIVGLELIDLRTDTADTASAVITGATGAAGGGTRLPLDTQLTVTLRTARRGRSFRGRIFLPGWGANANSSGIAVTAATTDAVEFVGNLRANWTAEDFVMAVASRKLLQANPVTSVVVRDARWDTLRRRDR